MDARQESTGRRCSGTLLRSRRPAPGHCLALAVDGSTERLLHSFLPRRFRAVERGGHVAGSFSSVLRFRWPREPGKPAVSGNQKNS